MLREEYLPGAPEEVPEHKKVPGVAGRTTLPQLPIGAGISDFFVHDVSSSGQSVLEPQQVAGKADAESSPAVGAEEMAGFPGPIGQPRSKPDITGLVLDNGLRRQAAVDPSADPTNHRNEQNEIEKDQNDD